MEILIMALIVIVLLVIAISVILISTQKKQIESLKYVSKNIANMNILQNMLEIMSSKQSAESKIKALNDVIISNYNVKYSSIAIFDGYRYNSSASNIESIYSDIVNDIASENDFKSNIAKNVSKYLTTAPEKTLLYKSAVERKIKSAMFSPIFCNGVYLGFWLLEDVEENAFDSIPKNELAKIKANIGIFLDIVEFQKSIENAQSIDKQTGFYNNIYLYSGVRDTIKNNEKNTIVMVGLKSIPEINDKYGRNVGNALLIKVANCIKNFIGKTDILVRYTGIRFLIIMPNTYSESLQPSMEKLLKKISLECEYIGENKVIVDTQFLLHTIKKQNDIEIEVEKMIEYMDRMSSVNTIKIL